MNIKFYICPCCNGDGKDTCHSPDHGCCDLCEGIGAVTKKSGQDFIDKMGYDSELVLCQQITLGAQPQPPKKMPDQYITNFGIHNYTGYCDLFGSMIYIGDTIQFIGYKMNVWQSKVILDDGLVTVSYMSEFMKQIQNPIGWDRQHDYIMSRGHGLSIGYGEYGKWDEARKSIVKIARTFNSYEQYKCAEQNFLRKNKQFRYAFQGLYRPLPVIKPLR